MSKRDAQDQGQRIEWATVLPRLRTLGLVLVGFGVVPMLVNALTPPIVPTKVRYWVVPRWWTGIVAGTLAIATGVAVWEVLHAPAWFAARVGGGGDVTDWLAQSLPFWVVNVAAGVLLIPAGWAWKRRRIARAVSRRQIDDVYMQEQIEKARTQAADVATSTRIGVRIDVESHEVVGVADDAVRGPHKLPNGRQAVGAIVRPTVRTFQDRVQDRQRVRQWQERGSRWLTVPQKAGQVRLVMIAESGQGKTVLLFEIMLALLEQGFRVVFLDGKGNPADAAALRAAADALGKSTAAPAAWNLFNGTSAEITDRVTRLFPQTKGDGAFYRDRAQTMLQTLQTERPVKSLADLRERAYNPKEFVKDAYDLDMLRDTSGPVKNSPPMSVAALHDVERNYKPLRALISEEGWSFDELEADLTTVTITPSDQAQKTLADLLLLGFRQHITKRAAAGDDSPLVVVIDEFAQLVSVDTDPAEFVASIQETGRSLGVGIIAATQSVAGTSNDAMMQKRLMSAGAGILIGRTNDPEDAVKYAGTVMRMEASGAATGDQLGSGRAQHTYALHPQTVRLAADGMFWLVQNGSIVPFRALPPAAAPTNANQTTTPPAEPVASAEPAPVLEATAPAVDTPPASPVDVAAIEGDGWEQAAPSTPPDGAGGVDLWQRSAVVDQTTTPPPTSAPEKPATSKRSGGVQFRTKGGS
jgi:hypothetical protein